VQLGEDGERCAGTLARNQDGGGNSFSAQGYFLGANCGADFGEVGQRQG